MLGRCIMCNLFIKQTRPVLRLNRRYMCSSNNENKFNFQLKHNQKILQVLNSENTDLVNSYNIPEEVNNALKLYREKHGAFTSVQDVLQVEGMNGSILNQFLHSFVKNKKYKIKDKYKMSTFTPTLRNIQYEENSTILGIYVGANIVTWTLLEVSENVLEWNYESFSQIPDNNSTPSLLQLAQQVNSKLPKCNIYVIDETTYDRHITKSIKYTRAFVQKQQLKAMLLGILLKQNAFSENNKLLANVYFTQHLKIATMFDLRIGTEIISSKVIMDKLLHKNSDNNKDKNPISVYVPNEIMNMYQSQKDYIQDQMNWSLLSALVFLQFGILKKYDCDLA